MRLVHGVPVEQIAEVVVLTDGQSHDRREQAHHREKGLDAGAVSSYVDAARKRKTEPEEEFSMADPITFPRSLDDVRAQVERIRSQGEKLVDRIRTDAQDLIARAPKVASIDEARKRAEEAVKTVQDLRARRTELLGRLVDQIVKTLGLAKAEQVTKLEARLVDLERRIAALGKTEQAA
ncbi:MAG: hypothetical protein ACREQL_10540 [Candidatus Binatia bacterium]